MAMQVFSWLCVHDIRLDVLPHPTAGQGQVWPPKRLCRRSSLMQNSTLKCSIFSHQNENSLHMSQVQSSHYSTTIENIYYRAMKFITTKYNSGGSSSFPQKFPPTKITNYMVAYYRVPSLHFVLLD